MWLVLKSLRVISSLVIGRHAHITEEHINLVM